LSPYNLPKKIILKTNIEFSDTIHHGRCFRNDYFTIFCSRADELRIGFTVKNDIASKPQRNFLKRRMREIFRLCFRNYRLPAEIVMIAQRSVETADFTQLEQTLNHTLNQIEKWLN